MQGSACEAFEEGHWCRHCAQERWRNHLQCYSNFCCARGHQGTTQSLILWKGLNLTLCRSLRQEGTYFVHLDQGAYMELTVCVLSLGGVHRAGQDSRRRFSHISRSALILPSLALDISADLPELTRCPVALVSAGVKSILDIGRFVSRFYSSDPDLIRDKCRTLEYLVSPANNECWILS